MTPNLGNTVENGRIHRLSSGFPGIPFREHNTSFLDIFFDIFLDRFLDQLDTRARDHEDCH
jgi:hypothetical protein